MTSYPRQPAPDWSASGQPSSPPLEALPAPKEALPAPPDSWAAPQDDWAAPQEGWAAPQDDWAPGPGDSLPRDGRPAGPPAGRPAGPTDGRRPEARPATSGEFAEPDRAGDERWAMLSYLGVPFLGFCVPLVIYLIKMRRSDFVRYQAAQALNLSITGLLYALCAMILGALLALDTIDIALVIVIPLVAALWIITLVYVVLAAATAGRGEYYEIPAWLCATMAR